ncbi:MAG: hypothetical protein ABR508_01920 [Candidatus Baltobacteraceae bacterium]
MLAAADGYTKDVLVHRLDQVLAQTDPFDLAQAVDRHVRSLSAPEIHELIDAALPRLNEYYVSEFADVNAHEQQASLQTAFAQSLKSNLRAIPLFGRAFGEAVLAKAGGERTVGFADERSRRPGRAVALGAMFVAALALAAAGGAQYARTARVQTANALPTPYIVLPKIAVAPARRRRPARVTPVPLQHRIAVAVPQAPAAGFAPVTAAPQLLPPVPARMQRQRARPSSLPVAQGEAVVTVPQPARPSASPTQAAPIDTSDMPQPYTDATPMPDQTAVPVIAPRAVKLITPPPAPRRHGWLHRTIMHFDPFKPHPQPTK